MTKRLTNSEMKVWRRCKRQWYLRVYRKLEPRGRIDFNRPTGIGTRVHDCLAAYYDPEQPKQLMPYFHAKVAEDLEKYPESAAEISKEADMCEAILEGYLIWVQEDGHDADLEVVSSEGKREAELMPGVNLLAKLDARVRRGDSLMALEHKTVGDLSTPLALLQLDTQLLTEHLVELLAQVAEGGDAETAAGVLYNMLRKTKRTARAKPPFYGREEVRHNKFELRNHWHHVTAQAREILETEKALDEGGTHHDLCYPNPTRDCKWDCPFFRVCGLFDDGSDPEPALSDLFAVGDPLSRYDATVEDQE